MTETILSRQGEAVANRRLLCFNSMKHPPGTVRDAIIAYLSEIKNAVESKIGDVPASSVRSYLRLRADMLGSE